MQIAELLTALEIVPSKDFLLGFFLYGTLKRTQADRAMENVLVKVGLLREDDRSVTPSGNG